MRLADVTAERALGQIYDDVLAPSFPSTELVSRPWLLESAASGAVVVTGAYEGEGPTAVAVSETISPGVVLLSYLAALPTSRGTGVGSRLLISVRERVIDDGGVLLLAEVERPDRHTGSAEHGDPAARLRFYARHGAQVLDLPYVQPPIRPGEDPVPGMLLLALYAAPAVLRHGGTGVDGPLVATAVEALLEEQCTDGAWVAALRSAARAPVVTIRPATQWQSVAPSAAIPPRQV